jgi:hypothetical protein
VQIIRQACMCLNRKHSFLFSCQLAHRHFGSFVAWCRQSLWPGSVRCGGCRQRAGVSW